MIDCIEGTIIDKTIDEMVVSCSGVGFRLYCPHSAYSKTPSVGASVFMYTHLIVKDDAFELYGFVTKEEQQCFSMLIAVSGVGPRTALSILSLYTPKQIVVAIAAGDYKVFSACQGIGPKIAQRLVLELKDKVGSLESGDSEIIKAITGTISSSKQEALAALVALGFTTSEAAAALAKLSNEETTEQLVSLALRSLSRI